MKTSLFPKFLSSCSRNFKKGFESASLFEVGPIFNGQMPEDQVIKISGLRYGKTGNKDWTNNSRDFDWLDAKADVEAVIKLCGLDPSKVQLKRSISNCYHSGRSGVFSLGKNEVAQFGEIHPIILENFNLKLNVVGFEINIQNIPLPKKLTSVKKLLILDTLQEVKREFSFIIDKNTSSGEITRCIASVEKDIIKEVRVFDVYEGKNVDKDKKSFGVTVIFQPKLESFSDQQLEEFSKKIIGTIGDKLGGYLRD